MTIGFDACGRTISIHETQDDKGLKLYAGHVHHNNGDRGYGFISTRLEDFCSREEFPSFSDIWPAPSYQYVEQHHRQRVYSAAIHHALLLNA